MIQQTSKSQIAMHWKAFKTNRVECTLCPRHCKPKTGSIGYCGVRGNVNNELHTFNYGKGLAATEEVIETEAINHYRPGARILSMGNIGCMMSCSFCQNWETSQVKHLDQRFIQHYSSQQIIDICLENEIDIISWTYNDPIVWHEFVLETSALAQANGIKTLYKSAFYIEEEPVNELIECIDIFSLSLKSMSEKFYQKVTRAKLGPVLERIKQVARSGKHLELSQLVIPELNDHDEDITRTARWVLEHLGPDIPLHFVAFHPAYQYTHVERTRIETLIRARTLAKKMGLQYVYLGNTHQDGLNDTHCKSCNTTLVRRYGLHAHTEHIDKDGRCSQCGTMSPVIGPLHQEDTCTPLATNHDYAHKVHLRWDTDVQSAHIMLTRGNKGHDRLRIRPIGPYPAVERVLKQGLDRLILSRQGEDDQGVVVSWNSNKQYELFPVLDRAHFPLSQSTEATMINLEQAIS